MQHFQISTDASTIHVVFTSAEDGDFQIDSNAEQLSKNRAQVIDQQWSWVRQVHSNQVIEITQPVGFAGVADGLMTKSLNCPIAVSTADCVPVVLVAADAVAVIHAGWRGIEAGVIKVGAEKMRAAGSIPFATYLGPHIGVEEYEFSPEDLERLGGLLGNQIIGVTKEGKPALDLYQAVVGQCRDQGLAIPEPSESTGSEKYFSHRLRQDRSRQATVAWITDNEQ